MEVKLMKAAFEVIVNNSTDLLFLKDINSVYHAASLPFIKMAGKSSLSEIIGRTDLEIFENETLAKRYIADDHRLLDGGQDLIDYIEPICDDNGNARYGSTSKYILRDSKGQVIGLLGITRDITTEYLARQRYQSELRYLFELPEDTYAVCYIDADSWRVISQRRKDISGGTLQECTTVDDMARFAVESIVDKSCKAAEFYRNFTAEALHEIYSSGRRTVSFKYERRLSDNSSRWVKNELNFLTDADSGHLCVMLSAKDINGIKQAQKRLEAAARLDSMTQLLNRETAMECIKNILENEKDRHHALFMLDIDNFKSLNDTLGHQAGDDFLIKLAKGLKEIFSESDVVGRIGGDEFFALMRNAPDRETVEKKACEILDTVRNTAADYPKVKLGGSIGIGVYPKDGNDLDGLYSKADSALYTAKRSGKNMYVFAE